MAGMLMIVLAGLLVITPATADVRESDATRHWVLGQLHAALAPPRDLDEISSMLYGLVSAREVTEQPDTRQALREVATLVRSLEPAKLACSDSVNLLLITGFLTMAGMPLDSTALSERVLGCLEGVNPYDKASALFSLCRLNAAVPRERLITAMEAIEALQQPDGSFGSGYGLVHFYISTHAVFALHACKGDPLAIQLGQDFISNGMPRLMQAGFIDALLQSLLMLGKMGVAIADEGRYVSYLRSRIKEDGSVCCFDRPGCLSDRHATSLLLEFLKTYPDPD
jgi:hypothetical protein